MFGRAVLAAASLVAFAESAAMSTSTFVAAPASPAPTVWPLRIPAAGGTIVLYEPQVRTWPNYTQMTGIAATAVTLPGAPAPVYGTLSFSSLASADVPAGMVSLVNPKLDATSWPTASQTDATALDAFLKANLHVEGKPFLPLAMVLSSIPRSQRPHTIPLRANPPVIYVKQSPAVLVVFDGKPSFAPIPGTALTYAVNTNWEIVHDPASGLYLRAREKRMVLGDPERAGPFTPTVAPASFAAIPATGPLELRSRRTQGAQTHRHGRAARDREHGARRVDRYRRTNRSSRTSPGRNFATSRNTTSDLFFSRDTTVWYVLLAGRWFSAANLNGPWTFASTHLPRRFPEDPGE